MSADAAREHGYLHAHGDELLVKGVSSFNCLRAFCLVDYDQVWVYGTPPGLRGKMPSEKLWRNHIILLAPRVLAEELCPMNGLCHGPAKGACTNDHDRQVAAPRNDGLVIAVCFDGHVPRAICFDEYEVCEACEILRCDPRGSQFARISRFVSGRANADDSLGLDLAGDLKLVSGNNGVDAAEG